MTREQKYTEQMKELGIYHRAFDPAIHTLAIMERENQRTMKALKTAAAEGEDKTAAKLRADIAQQRRDILAHRDALGLTPKALRRLKTTIQRESERDESKPTVLEFVRSKAEKTS